MMPLNFEIYLWTLAICVFLFLVDDLFIDLVSLFKKLGPQAVAPSVLYDPLEQRNLAIMVANWKEDDVLDPRLPYLYSLGLRRADFVQTPVLSLPLGAMEFTGGTYLSARLKSV